MSSKVTGTLLFLIVIYTVFLLTFSAGGSIKAVIATIGNKILDVMIRLLAEKNIAINPYVIPLTKTIGQGIILALEFFPIIAIVHFCIEVLQQSRYMMRAEAAITAVTEKLGLSGSAIVSMIIGFGCNVPAILSTNNMAHNSRDKVKAILMTPFMSCSARLSIYAIFVAAFFKGNEQNIIFVLYLIGIFFAFITGMIFYSGKLEPSFKPPILKPFVMPRLWLIVKHAVKRSSKFVKKILFLIMPCAVVLNLLSEIELVDGRSVLMTLGQAAAPVFKPMGLGSDNWQAVCGLISGLIAKELVLGSLAAAHASGAENINVVATLFEEPAQAFAYLLFLLLYFPCFSVMAAIAKELSKLWAVLTALWTTIIAYTVAVVFYQVATFAYHPYQSMLLLSIFSLCCVSCMLGARKLVNRMLQPCAIGIKSKIVVCPE